MVRRTHHEEIVDKLDAERTGFARRLRALLRGAVDERWRPGVVPDAHALLKRLDGADLFLAIEVQDTHAISPAKIGRYVAIWWKLDSISDDPQFVLVVVDRLGAWAEIDLASLALSRPSDTDFSGVRLSDFEINHGRIEAGWQERIGRFVDAARMEPE